MVLGAKQHDFTNCDESIKHMAGFDHPQAQNSGYPVKFYSSSSSKPLSFLPWDERRTRKELETATRSQFRDHIGCITTLPYGFVVDMQVAQYVLNSPTSYEMMSVMSPYSLLQFYISTIMQNSVLLCLYFCCLFCFFLFQSFFFCLSFFFSISILVYYLVSFLFFSFIPIFLLSFLSQFLSYVSIKVSQ